MYGNHRFKLTHYLQNYNPGAERIFGFAAIEIVGQNIIELIPSSYRNTHKDGLARLVGGGRPKLIGLPTEVEGVRKDGSTFPLELSISEVRFGDVLMFTAIGRDITERKNTELAIQQAKVAAERADRAKSEFLANMSHEIRTPMTAILGFAETIAENIKKPENIEAIATVRRNGEHLLNIINDILDISKIEAGKMQVELIPHNPCTLVADVASLVEIRARAKGLAFEIEYIGDIPETIHTDPTRLRQILINLIGNAIKFTEEGSVKLITSLVREGGESYLQFDVLDTGIGMSEEQIASLFQPFTQADNSITRKFGGTGLGLTISKRFTELLGGDITIADSKIGVGTRFRATVAIGSIQGVKMIENPQSITVQASARESRIPLADLTGLRILLAEDGPDNQRLISFVLEKAGAIVKVMENGKLALDAALAARDKGNAFDCILMDMQMPVMSGYEATSKLRDANYVGPIIALTAHAMAGDREKCIKAGCDDFANKPINRAMLIDLIARHSQRAAAA